MRTLTRAQAFQFVLAVLAGLAAIVLGVVAMVETQPAGNLINLLGSAAGCAGFAVVVLALPIA